MGEFRGKRAELNVYDDYLGKVNLSDIFDIIEPLKYPKDAPQEYLGFNPSYIPEGIVTKSHQEGDITVIDDFRITGVSIVKEIKI